MAWECSTCANKSWCRLFRLVRSPCPYYIPAWNAGKKPKHGRPLTTDGAVIE